MADYRCKKIKEEAYRLVEETLQTLVSQSSENEIPDFRDQVDSILFQATAHYTRFAGAYKQMIQGKY